MPGCLCLMRKLKLGFVCRCSIDLTPREMEIFDGETCDLPSQCFAFLHACMPTAL